MILVVAPAGPVREAVAAAFGDDVRVVEPGDPAVLVSAMRGVERMFLHCDDPVAAADVVSAAEMAHVYHCVVLGPLDALTGSSLRWTILLPPSDGEIDVAEVATLTARALTEQGHENTTYALSPPL